MEFFTSALLLAATAMALPQPGDGDGGGSHVKFPVGDKTTLSEAQAKCDNDAKVSCCNKATYTRHITNVNQGGPLAGVLQSALGGGPGGDGLGLFGQCNDISANSNRPK
ncbi:conidial hydrophobin Hyp1/RodA [Penicillium cinerascens]|uniref:Conidial hydrophobin Hyp1/RodA n=1 Tax=Penicillium cinerascens TaxID=70096 RepID=A0A9W9MPG1_9EURO|nr:conidial hydrophobin Hyp1/RodA [Penicillium cinerascens]KAJ5205077.1 conidial hydrophobin Hyp1/RodA [Penicillium cinerascens]